MCIWLIQQTQKEQGQFRMEGVKEIFMFCLYSEIFSKVIYHYKYLRTVGGGVSYRQFQY